MTVTEGIAGTTKGSFFGHTPSFVNNAKLPGTSTQILIAWKKWFISSLSFRHMLWSPNLIWFLMACFTFILFPYNMEQAKVFQSDWIVRRTVINLCVVYGYTGSVLLGVNLYSKRKFRPDMNTTFSNALHNIFYTTCGTLQWTVWEILFVHLCATGKLPYVSLTELNVTTSAGRWMLLREILIASIIPHWRSFHFYWSHRFLHIPFLYRNIHALHHRNIDIEPFAGLCMHPIEHLYYFSCLGPSFFLR